MATRQVMRHCDNCQRQTLHLQQYMSAGTHIVLLLITGGLWLLALIAYYVLGGWLIEPVRKAMEKGKCTICGSAPRPAPLAPPAPPTTPAVPSGGLSWSSLDPAAKAIFIGCGIVLLGALGANAYRTSPTPAASASIFDTAPHEAADPNALRQEASAPPAAPPDDGWTTLTGVSSDAQLGFVCQAVVAATMGHPIQIMHVERSRGGEADVRYNRPSDGSLWRTRCKIENGAVVWRTIDAFGPGSGLGRWRDAPEDSRITVAVRDDALRVVEVFSDGSRSVQEIDLTF